MISVEQKEYLLPKACNAAIRAGAAILEIYNSGDEIDVDLKSDHTPITMADRSAHTTIREYLAKTRIPLLSEEGREMLYTERKDWDLFWIVDPLDGTVEFIKGNGEFTVNIALMSDNVPVFGVIYVPLRKLLYFSDGDMGAFCRKEVDASEFAELTYADLFRNISKLPLTSGRNTPIRIAVSRSHRNEQTTAHIDKIKEKYNDAELVVQGSSYKLCLIAEGSVDYYARTTDTYEWDTAAGQSILEAAGGQIKALDEKGSQLAYNKETLLNPHFVCRSKWFEV